jgi:hypothetical protein
MCAGPPLSLQRRHDVEFWVKLNTPESDASETCWLDGVERGTGGAVSGVPRCYR